MLESSFTLLQAIGEMNLNDTHRVRFSIDAYHGYRYVSVRMYALREQMLWPTREGVTLTPEIVRTLVPRLLDLPQDSGQIALGPVGKFAKRPGICVEVAFIQRGVVRGLEFRPWSQEKGYTAPALFLPLAHWVEIRRLFEKTLTALNAQPDIEF